MKPLATTWPFRLRATVSPILLLAILAAAPAAADPSFQISFLVDYRSAVELASPAVAVQGEGETAFVWRGECPQPGFCLSHYTPGQQPPTPPVLLDVGASVPDSPPRVAVGAGEELVVVWSEPAADGTRRVALRIYDFFGLPLGPKRLVAAAAGEVFAHPDVAVTPAGELVVAFEHRGSGDAEGAGIEILGRRLAADGSPLGPAFRVDGPTSAEVAWPRVAAGPDETVFVWESRLGGAGEGIGMCRVTDLAAPECAVGDAFAAPRSATFQRREPAVAASAQGTFLVAWTDVDPAPAGVPAVRFQVLRDGAALLAEPPSYDRASTPAVDGADDVFLLVWTAYPLDEPRHVLAQRLDAFAQPLEGGGYLISSAHVLGTGVPLTPDAGLYGRGGLDTAFVAGWRHRDPQGELSIIGARASSQTSPPTSCTETGEKMCLGAGNRFRVRALWSRSRPAPAIYGRGRQIEITPDTGYFWFFRETNVEVLVKVLDGCAVNGHYWVFAAGLTDLDVILDVYDTQNQESEIYHSEEGRPFQPIQDTGAFPCG